MAAKRKKTKVVIEISKPPTIYELADLSESQQWIRMIDDTYRVKSLYESRFVKVMGEVSKRQSKTSMRFIDSVNNRR